MTSDVQPGPIFHDHDEPPLHRPDGPVAADRPVLSFGAHADAQPRSESHGWFLIAAALAVGIFAAIVVPYRDHGIGTFLLLLAAGGVVLGFAAHRRDPFTLACAGLCVLLASTTVLRDAEWIVVLCVLGGGALCMAGLVNGRGVPAFVLSGLAWPAAALRGLPWLGRSLRGVTGLGQAPAVVRAVAWSLLAVVVFGLLFASADALFAEWAGAVVPDLGSESLALRAFLTVAVTGVTLAAAYVAINPPAVELTTSGGRPAAYRFEWLAPVLVVDLVFAVFLVAQATVIFGGHDYLERTTGLTYAASSSARRSAFFRTCGSR